MTIRFGQHCARAWTGTAIEQSCPCPKEPCGLVDPGRAHPDCLHHPLKRGKSFRQIHSEDHCPGTQSAPGAGDSLHAPGAHHP